MPVVFEGPTKLTPNPGSAEAVKKGCTCAVLDNAHGAGFTYGPDKAICHWITEGCPLHAPAKPCVS